MAAPAAAIRISRLAKMRAGYQAWRKRQQLAAAQRRLNAAARAKQRTAYKLSKSKQKVALATEKARLAEQRALAKGYRKGKITPGAGGRAGAEAAGTAPIAAAILGSSYIGSAGALGREMIDEAGDLLDSEPTQLPDMGTGQQSSVDLRAELAAQRQNNHADRALALKLARLDARTRVRIAREQRKMAREVAFLNNPVIGVGVAFSLGAGTLAGLHAIGNHRDISGYSPGWAEGVKSALATVPTFAAPTLPTGLGSGSSFQITPPQAGP